ncbi:cysteine hydrolase family protein [Bordetella sp. 2513F-2]
MTCAAVLALHYQNDVLHPQGRIRLGVADDDALRARLFAGAAALLGGARERGLPLVHVRIAFREDGADLLANCRIFQGVAASGAVREGQWGSEFHEALAPLPHELVVTHRRISAFHGTPLDELLRARGVGRLVVAGVATHSVVEGTVRHASDIGYEVMVAEEACAAADAAVHAAALASMRLVAEVGTVADALQWAVGP